MKRLVFSIILILVCSPLWSEEVNKTDESNPLSIAIVGVTNYDDVNFVTKNLKRSSFVGQLVVATSSRGFVELLGSYNGSRETVIEEIQNLVQDRFSQEVLKSKRRNSREDLSITLRKLPPPAPTS